MIKLRNYKKERLDLQCITLSGYLAHSEPIITSLNLLKVTDMFKLCQIKFYYKYIRNIDDLNIITVKHEFATKCILYSISKCIIHYCP